MVVKSAHGAKCVKDWQVIDVRMDRGVALVWLQRPAEGDDAREDVAKG